MELSRPIMKALHSLGWEEPTPIQAAVIPKALMGLDICACAATGTGKSSRIQVVECSILFMYLFGFVAPLFEERK